MIGVVTKFYAGHDQTNATFFYPKLGPEVEIGKVWNHIKILEIDGKNFES